MLGIGLVGLAAVPEDKEGVRQPSSTVQSAQQGRVKRVAVIGAGASGLISAKCLLDEGFEVTVYEQEPHLGGLWRYGDSTDGHSGCYRSLRTLSTKRMTSFRDHPIEEWMSRKETKSLVAKLRASASPWAHHSQIFAYLEDFAEAHALPSKIQFNTRVLKVSPLRTEDAAGGVRWQVKSVNRQTSEEQVAEFDAVVVCHGHHWDPMLPNIAGMSTFKGRQLHSREYRQPEAFKNQRVVIVGMGDSGSAIGAEISSVAAVTYFSTSRDQLPLNLWKRHVRRQTPKPRVVQVKEHSVVFSDETEEEVDAIVYCTGYRLSFPFLEDPDLRPTRTASAQPRATTDERDSRTEPWLPCGEKTALYQRVFHPNYPNLAFIGLVDVHLFSVFPVSEVQSKWVACVLGGRCALPAKAEMEKEIACWEDSVRHVCYQPMLIDGVPYISQIKSIIKQGRKRDTQPSEQK